MPVMVLPMRLGRGAMLMSSHIGDDTDVSWPRRNIDAQSCR
jgi:hypothetical protein